MGSESLYRSLQQHLDRMPIGFPATASGVEIRILERLFTLKEAEIALGLSAMPEPARVIHNRLKAPGTLEELRSALDEMERKGLILRLSGPGEPRYGKLIFAIGVYERQLPRMTPEFERDVRQYMEEAFHSAFHSTRTTQMRIVPVNRSVSVERSVATYDDIRGHIEKSAGPFAKAPCICRHGKDLLGEPCKQTDLRENCLTIGMAAGMDGGFRRGPHHQPPGDARSDRRSRPAGTGPAAAEHARPDLHLLLLPLLLRGAHLGPDSFPARPITSALPTSPRSIRTPASPAEPACRAARWTPYAWTPARPKWTSRAASDALSVSLRAPPAPCG